MNYRMRHNMQQKLALSTQLRIIMEGSKHNFKKNTGSQHNCIEHVLEIPVQKVKVLLLEKGNYKAIEYTSRNISGSAKHRNVKQAEHVS